MKKIVFLDLQAMGTDIDVSYFSDLGEVISYQTSTSTEARERAKEADVLVVNKVLVNEYTISEAKNLKLVCVSATGTNNIDKEYLKKRNIEWKNAENYSSDSVAQHTFAMYSYLNEHLRYYDDYVKNGDYIQSETFCHIDQTFHELNTCTWGIIGLGNIGRKVANIANAFGAKVIYASPSNGKPQEGYTQVDLDTLYRESDIISIHSPLNEYTENMINRESLSKMKSNCILLNLARGPIVVEEDLAYALDHHMILAAGLDVLKVEPMLEDNPLYSIKEKERLLITPHIGWASIEARNRLMRIVYSHIQRFMEDSE